MIVKTITSKENNKIKLLKKLKQKKYREKEGRFFVENLNIIKDGLKAGFNFQSLFVTENFIKKYADVFGYIINQAKAKEYYVIDEKINKFFSELETPSGICAVYEKGKERIDLKSPVVYLNNINDPGNLGTILRSAIAFNFKNIVLDETCADFYNSKTINAAKDSILKLNFTYDKDLKILKKIKKKMKVFATNVKGGEDVGKLKKEKLFCVVLGSEAKGVSKEILEMSDRFIKIKINDIIESVNVASAASIIFYELSKK